MTGNRVDHVRSLSLDDIAGLRGANLCEIDTCTLGDLRNKIFLLRLVKRYADTSAASSSSTTLENGERERDGGGGLGK